MLGQGHIECLPLTSIFGGVGGPLLQQRVAVFLLILLNVKLHHFLTYDVVVCEADYTATRKNTLHPPWVFARLAIFPGCVCRLHLACTPCSRCAVRVEAVDP